MNGTEGHSVESTPYRPRKSAANVKKPVIFPGNTIITGTPDMLEAIDRLCPNEGNRRRESLMLWRMWTEKFGSGPGPKSALVALAAHALQGTDKAFGDQVRKSGNTVAGFCRAKCTMSKTCYWMLTEGLFVEVGKVPTPNPANVPDPADQPDVPEPASESVEVAVSIGGGVMRTLTRLKDLW